MSRLGPLRAGRWAAIAVLAVAILLGIGWGLPSRPRMAMLLAGGPPTPRQVELLNSLHTLRAQGQLPADSLPAPGTDGRGEGISEAGAGRRLALSEIERLYALRSYILGSGEPDEDYTMVAIGNMNPRSLDFDPKRYIYGGSYLYPVGAVLFAMQAARLLQVTHDFSYYLHEPEMIARIYLAGRLLNLMALIGTLLLLIQIGRRLGGETAATVAMLAYGLATLIIDYTVLMKPHVFTAFWVTLAIHLLLVHVQEGSRRALVLSALAMGYAAGSTVTAAIMGLVYPFMLFDRARLAASLRRCLAVGVLMALMFLVTNPYTLLNVRAYAATVSTVSASSGTGLSVLDLGKLPWYLVGTYVVSYAFPLALVGLPFMLACIVRGAGPRRRLALATTALVLIFGTMSAQVRLTAFIAPLMCLFGGLAIAEWIIAPLRPRPRLRASLVALLFLPAVVNAGLSLRDVIFDSVWERPTTQWVRDARIGPGTSIGVFRPPSPVDLVPFPFLNAHLVDMNFPGIVDPPEYVMVGSYKEYSRRLWAEHPLRPRYRLLHDLGYRPSYDRIRSDKWMNEARTGGYVYQLVDRGPAGDRPAPPPAPSRP